MDKKQENQKELEKIIGEISNSPAYPINITVKNNLTKQTEIVSIPGISFRDYKQTKYMASLLSAMNIAVNDAMAEKQVTAISLFEILYKFSTALVDYEIELKAKKQQHMNNLWK